jgi:hypothetical protein
VASLHSIGNLVLQSALAGRQTSASPSARARDEGSVEPPGGFQNVSERGIVIQREQKCKAIWVHVETMQNLLANEIVAESLLLSLFFVREMWLYIPQN